MRELKLLPAQMLPLLNDGATTDNTETIRLYLISEPGAVVLTDFQNKLKERYDFADNLMRSRHYSYKAIENILCKRFGYEVATARRDIATAQYLYGSMLSRDKKYIIALHHDFFQDCVNKLMAKGLYKEAESFAKLMLAAADKLPERNDSDNQVAAIIYNFGMAAYEHLTEKKMDSEQAAAIAKEHIEEADWEDMK